MKSITQKWESKFIDWSITFSGPEENVASAKFNSKTIRGELRSALLDGDVTNYDMEKGTNLSFSAAILSFEFEIESFYFENRLHTPLNIRFG